MITPVAFISFPAITTSLIGAGMVNIRSNSSTASITSSSIIGKLILTIVVPTENVANIGLEI